MNKVRNPHHISIRCALAPTHTLANMATALVEQWMPKHQFVAKGGFDYERGDDWIETQQAPIRDIYANLDTKKLCIRAADHFGRILLTAYDDKRPGGPDRNTFGHTHCVILHFLDILDKKPLARAQSGFSAAHLLIEFLFEHFEVWDLMFSRSGSGFAPNPPLANIGDLARIVRTSEVEAAYEDPAVYWQAWDTQRDLGDGRVWVERASTIIDELAFIQATYPSQWQMARAAKPKLTTYGALASGMTGFSVNPEEQDYFQQGEGIIQSMHYQAETQTLDVTAWADPGIYIAPREAAQILHWRFNKQLDKGEPLKEVRFVFLNREQAEAQKRVLLDMRCRVFHMGATPTELVEVTDA